MMGLISWLRAWRTPKFIHFPDMKTVTRFTEGVTKAGKKWTQTAVTEPGKVLMKKGLKYIDATGAAVSSGAAAAGQTVLTWGNAAKVAITGAFAWLFLNGGASRTVAATLGVSEEFAQLLVWVVALIVVIWLINWFVNWLKYKALNRVTFGSKKIRGVNRRYSGGRRR